MKHFVIYLFFLGCSFVNLNLYALGSSEPGTGVKTELSCVYFEPSNCRAMSVVCLGGYGLVSGSHLIQGFLNSEYQNPYKACLEEMDNRKKITNSDEDSIFDWIE